MKLKMLKIKNFQSAKNLEVEFEESGVFRFKGPNNVGKSVILKAISTLMRNVSNHSYKEFLRDEEDTFEIIGTDFKGNRVHLSRGAVDFYTWSIDGVEGREDRTGGKVPITLEKYFNLYIEKEKTNECLNIRLPDDLLLYVNTTGGDNAMMFQKALGTEEYMVAIKQVDSRARELKKEIQLVGKYLVQEDEKLKEAESGLKQVENAVEEITRYEEVLKEERDRYLLLTDMEQETREFAQLTKEVGESQAALDQLNMDGIEEDIEQYEDLTKIYGLYEENLYLREQIKRNNEKLEQCGTDTIKVELELYKNIEEVVSVYEEVEKLENKLEETVVVNLDQENDLASEFEKLQKIEEVLELAKEIGALTKSAGEGSTLSEQKKQEIVDIEKEMGYCPMCENEFPHTH